MKLKTYQYFAIALLGGLIASCKDNDIVYDTDPEGKEFRAVSIALPLGKVKIPLYETLRKEMNTDDSLRIDENGVMYVEYAYDAHVEWTDSIGIKEFANEFSYEIIDNVALPPGVSIPDENVSYTYNGVRDTSIVLTTATTTGDEDASTYVDKVTFSAGQFTFEIDLPTGFDGNFLLEIPQLTLAGQSAPFSRHINTSTAIDDDYVIDLAGATIETDEDHAMKIKYAFSIGGSLNLSNADDKVTVAYEMSGISVSSLFGYFGEQEPTDQEEREIELNFFNDFELDGQFGFDGITIDAVVTNRLGIPLYVESDLSMYRDETKLENALALNPPFVLDVSPAVFANETVNEVISRFHATATLNLGGNNLPNKIKFKVGGKSNPNPNRDGKSNFLVKDDTHESLIDVELTIHIPFRFKTSLYTRKDTIDFDFNDLIKDSETESECVDNAELKLVLENGLPIEIGLSMYAVGADGQKLDKAIISDHTITGGVPNGNQITPERSELSVRLTQDQIKEFRDRNVKSLLLETGAKTAGNDFVTLNDQSFLTVEASFSATVSISSELF